MSAVDKTPEREQTDESLRVEREKADTDLAERQSAIDAAADAIIERARARADRVLEEARTRSDRSAHPSDGPLAKIREREREREDRLLRSERASADGILRAERAAQAPFPSAERDETDKDLFQERARSDRALSARDACLGIVSHDLRHLLGVIIGSAALIAKGATQPDHEEQVVASADRIQRTGARMNRLVGDLVDVASIEAGALAVRCEWVDPDVVVSEAVDNFQAQAAGKGISLTKDVSPGLPMVSLDPSRILQVLVNLLSNALKFTKASGAIVVRVQSTTTELRFSVTDTGIGIPGDKLEAVFERFLQVDDDRRGVGLGLYISKCIVQGHNGRIWAESTLGNGSCFSFTLPIRGSSESCHDSVRSDP
jgi:signal transduction histidine kinase